MPDLKQIAIAAGAAKRVITGIREGIAWFRERGVLRDELLALLDQAEAEGRDLTDLEYAALAGGAQDAIDELLQAGMQARAGVPAPVPPAADVGGANDAGGADAGITPAA